MTLPRDVEKVIIELAFIIIYEYTELCLGVLYASSLCIFGRERPFRRHTANENSPL
jgi:hypothetical protein